MGKRWLAIAVAGLGLIARGALAATPGVNLSWANCQTTPASAARSYACDGALGYVVSFEGSFRASRSVPDFVGCSSVLDIAFASSTPDYWKTNSGECNAGALTIVNPSSTPPCVSTNVFDPSSSGGGFLVTYPEPDHVRIRVDWATGAPTPPSVTAGQLYPAFKLSFDPDAGAVHCGDCAAPGCVVLVSVEVFGFGDNEDERITTPDVRAYVTWRADALGSANGNACGASQTSQNRTWGALKTRYH